MGSEEFSFGNNDILGLPQQRKLGSPQRGLPRQLASPTRKESNKKVFSGGGPYYRSFHGRGYYTLEAWLLQRRSLGLDISKLAAQTTTGRLEEMENAAQSNGEVVLDPEMKPVAMRGNALEFRKIMADLGAGYENISLACIHPPYLNALQYTKDDENDLSRIADPREFARRIGLLAQEVHGALKPDGLCAVLMGDVRKAGRLIPLGLETLVQFLKTGFDLQDSIIKAQHRDRSSEFYLN